MNLTKEIIFRVVESQETHGCIECGAKYFHAPECRHGIGLPADELVNRIRERAARLLPVWVEQCHFCGGDAHGTLWVSYHGTLNVVSAHPACNRCQSSYSEPDSRPWGFVPGVVTKSTLTIEDIIK